MSRRAPGLLIISVLLPLMGMLLVLQAAYDSLILWILFIVVALAVFVVGVTSAATASRRPSPSDEARLDELEPLRPEEGNER
ncbi:hypothetical protein J4573_30230 [Actinomadura barringtoniae]|uniref:Uncharacterized protein n=1 Tax=Actinomadura barringtoniae TaxID=1427535 RepID=A0A939T9H8_9ACTN|nr:hypothetical protein [Actinomadura barringtoniae]MBO2451402.1 hypothetical protein [Actinomadura barringtoniae]